MLNDICDVCVKTPHLVSFRSRVINRTNISDEKWKRDINCIRNSYLTEEEKLGTAEPTKEVGSKDSTIFLLGGENSKLRLKSEEVQGGTKEERKEVLYSCLRCYHSTLFKHFSNLCQRLKLQNYLQQSVKLQFKSKNTIYQNKVYGKIFS